MGMEIKRPQFKAEVIVDENAHVGPGCMRHGQDSAVLANPWACVFLMPRVIYFLVNSFAQVGHPITTNLVWYKN